MTHSAPIALASFSPVVIAPTYNNASTLLGVLARVEAIDTPIIVVNDGSKDETASLLHTWVAEKRRVQVTVLTHETNQGKAAALQTGFAAAAKAGHTHAITMDTDGQLDPEQIPDLLALAARQPCALVIGARDDRAADYPARSRIGRRISNFTIWLECGARVEDSQCGLRVYPLRLFEVAKCRAGRFTFEAEIITRAAWAGCEIVNVPVNCRYFEGEKRVSHFRPWRDTLHGIVLHAPLLARAMWPWPHEQCCPELNSSRKPQ